jgi:hyperosmotically inducible periplasmic protein
MRRGIAVFSVVALTVISLACSETDAGVTTKVKSKLAADDTVKAYQIDVDTSDHVVTLSGNVESDAAKDRAVVLAKQTEGVKDVVVNITVSGGSAALPGEHDASPADANADERARDPGGAVTDAALTTAVKSKLLVDPTVGGLKIDVDTRDGVVTLTGNVATSKEESEALQIARRTDGVKRVEDKLKVVPAK